jgi:hypothetical protein
VFSRRSRSIRVGDRWVPAPSLPVQGLIVALHASVNPPGSQSHADLDRALLRLPGAHWVAAAAAARELGAEGALADGLRLSGTGRRMVVELGLDGFTDATTQLRRSGRPSFELGWHEVRNQPRAVDQVRLLLLKAFPSRAAVRMWLAQADDASPLAAFYLRRWAGLLAAASSLVFRSLVLRSLAFRSLALRSRRKR